MTEEKGLLAALERIADAAEKGEQGSGGLGRMARDAVAAYKARPVAPASADEVLRPALLDHYPQGVWHQQDGGYAGSCVCGHLFAGRILWEARSAWADHVIAALTAQAHPAGDDGGWREIESAATRKGFECLVRNDRGIFVAWFDPEWADVGWWLVSDGKNDGHPLRGSAPTHWMPLPIDPTTGTSQDQGERG